MDSSEIAVGLAEQRHGVVTRDRLRRAGLSRNRILALADSSHWERVTPEVLRRVGSPRTRAQSVAIAVLDAGPGARLSHVSVGNWWGLRGCRLEPFHVVRLSNSRRIPERAVVHRVRALPAAWTTVLDGIPVVRPELCALQLFATCSYERAERLTDSLWSMRLLSGPSLRRFVADMGAMGRNGTAGVRRYLDDRPADYVPPASGLESRVARILAEVGIELTRQLDVGSSAQWTGRVDFAVTGSRVLIEVQSDRYHAALVDRVADAERIRSLEADGFVVVQVWEAEVWTRPDVVVQRVLAAMRTA